jgi:DNA-binding SARP family transcriptional activator/tetratricopeptide (TPR) repeat protein
MNLQLLGPLSLRTADGRELHSVLAQPKRLAIFAYLACASGRGLVRRDVLTGLFWPDLDQQAARKALRQSLWVLRGHLGAEAITTRGDDEVGIAADRVSCDVVEFERALEAGRAEEALERYRGDLLAGFYLPGGSLEFERWLEDERGRLRALAQRAAWQLAERAEGQGASGAAVLWARRALALAGDDETAVRRFLRLLDRAGDRAGALRAYEAFARRLKVEFNELPSPETRALVDALRQREAPQPGRSTPEPARRPPEPPPVAAPPQAPAPPGPRRRWGLFSLVGWGLGALVLAGVLWQWRWNAGRTTPPGLLLVGDISPGDSASRLPVLAGRTLPELLATDFSRVPGLSVVSSIRRRELLAELGDSASGGAARSLARAAGASDVLEGIVYQLSEDRMRLDLRRVSVRTGAVRQAVSVSAPDPFALADSAVAAYTRLWRLAPPGNPLREETSISLEALSLYSDGVALLHQGTDPRGAAALFEAALRRDSLFAMAAYGVYRSLVAARDPNGPRWLERARAPEMRATDRERRIIATTWAADMQDPGLLAAAESLVSRYPGDLESELQLASAYLWDGRFDQVIALLRPLVSSPAARRTSGDRCPICEAYSPLIAALQSRDSLALAARIAAEWTRVQPASPNPWLALAGVHFQALADSAALAALDSAATRSADVAALDVPVYRGMIVLRQGLVDSACALFRALSTETRFREEGLWRTITCLRVGGRLREAEHVARQFELEYKGAVPRAQVLYEAGQPREAARLFDSMAVTTLALPAPGWAARWTSWHQTHLATCLAAAGDTARLGRLADSIALLGNRTAFGRNRRMAPYVRGLLLVARGEIAAAPDSFRAAAAFAPSDGYSRANLALARTLLRLGRPGEAIPWLQAALRSSMEGSAFYATWSETHELAARAFAAAGEMDSARAHAAWLARAWRAADPAFRKRAHEASRLAGLEP